MGEPFRYRPHFQTDPRVDIERCRASVHSPGDFRGHQCSRKPLDGSEWCKQHSPEEIERRLAAAMERYEAKQKHSDWHRLAEAQKENERLCAELLEARAEIERLHDRIAELQRNAARGATEI